MITRALPVRPIQNTLGNMNTGSDAERLVKV